jgi:hypothetical protein
MLRQVWMGGDNQDGAVGGAGSRPRTAFLRHDCRTGRVPEKLSERDLICHKQTVG